MKETWYRVRPWSISAKPVNVIKETEHTVTIDDGNGAFRIHKSSESERVFKSWSDARQYIIERARSRCIAADKELAKATADLHSALSLPENPP